MLDGEFNSDSTNTNSGRNTSRAQPSKLWPRLRVASAILSFLCFQCLFVFIVLKLDSTNTGKTGGGIYKLDWGVIIGPWLGGCAFFAACYMAISYFTKTLAMTHNVDAAASFLFAINIQSVDEYHELWIFRDLLLLLSFFILCMYGLFISLISCPSCQTPYKLFSAGCAVLYLLRMVHLVWYHTYAGGTGAFKRLRLLCNEIKRFQEFFEGRRLFTQVFPDITWQSTQNSSNLFVYVVWSSTCLLCFLAFIWIVNKNCWNICPATYLCTKYLLYAVCCLEFCFVFSEGILMYYHRDCGLESVETLINRLEDNKKREQKRLQRLQEEEVERLKNDTAHN